MSDSQFTLGQHAALIANLESDVGEIKSDVKALLGRDERRKGAWAVVVSVASFSGAVAALVLSWVKG